MAVAALLAGCGEDAAPSAEHARQLQRVARPVSEGTHFAQTGSALSAQVSPFADLEAKIADTGARLGKEHPRTLALRTTLGCRLNSSGRHAEAEAEHRAVLEIRQRTAGPDHPDILSSRKMLGAALLRQGKYAAARAEYDVILSIRLQDEETAEHGWWKTWRQMPPLWFPQGLETEPHDVYLGSLDSMIRVPLLDHPESEAGLPFRGVVLDHTGRLNEAVEVFSESSMEKVLGSEHPDTLRSRHYVGSPLSGLGRFAEVEANERDILAIQQRVLGPDHEDVLATRIFLATSLRNQERYEEARAEAIIALEAFQKVRGPDDPATIASRRLLEDLDAPR